MVKFGLKIKTLRKAGGWTQKTLAAQSGVAYATLQDIESGEGNPTIETLEALASTLGEPIVSFFALDNGGRIPGELLGAKGVREGLEQEKQGKRNKTNAQLSGAKLGSKTFQHGKTPLKEEPRFFEALEVLEHYSQASNVRRLSALFLLSKDKQYLEALDAQGAAQLAQLLSKVLKDF